MMTSHDARACCHRWDGSTATRCGDTTSHPAAARRFRSKPRTIRIAARRHVAAVRGRAPFRRPPFRSHGTRVLESGGGGRARRRRRSRDEHDGRWLGVERAAAGPRRVSRLRAVAGARARHAVAGGEPRRGAALCVVRRVVRQAVPERGRRARGAWRRLRARVGAAQLRAGAARSGDRRAAAVDRSGESRRQPGAGAPRGGTRSVGHRLRYGRRRADVGLAREAAQAAPERVRRHAGVHRRARVRAGRAAVPRRASVLGRRRRARHRHAADQICGGARPAAAAGRRAGRRSGCRARLEDGRAADRDVDAPWTVHAMRRRFIVAAAVVLGWVASRAQDLPAWPDTFESRVQALALMQTLNADVLGSRSATAALERWCRDHTLAENPTIVAALRRSVNRTPTSEQRQRLQVPEHDAVAFRHVQLRCGDRVLSEADNWYVPARLTAEMNRVLETTDTPFGRAVQSLEPYRQTFSATLLWSPLPDGWERPSTTMPASTGGALAIPDKLFEHRAILYTRDHVPFSEVDEIYQRQILAFPPRRF